ncbi:MAG: glycoside hydrolase family 43 protein [Planctomycetaceae bacterium]|jgi:beta-xylosidase|nr:glycoside hydrolase family 43 protein [Planctomycetaceae bacterium]
MRTKNIFCVTFIFPAIFGVFVNFCDIVFAISSIDENVITASIETDKNIDKKNNSDGNSPNTSPNTSQNTSPNKSQNKSDGNIVSNGGGGKVKTDMKNVWLFVYFMKKGHDGLFYAWSDDGLLWRQIREGKPFIKPEVGGDVRDRVMRAPSVCRSVDGVYHIVWAVGRESRSIGYASSSDLAIWSKQKLIPVMEHEKNTRNTWDPELFYDSTTKRFYIIWASTVKGKFKETDGSSEGDFNHRLYYTTTTDFKNFTKTELYWNPNHNVMDPLLVEDKDGDPAKRYLLFYKDETLNPVAKKYLLLATGSSPTGPFNVQKIVSHTEWVQGPSALKIGDDWYLYYDCYGKRHFGAVKSKDLNNWTNITEKLCFPTNARQGTIIEIDKETLTNLQKIK